MTSTSQGTDQYVPFLYESFFFPSYAYQKSNLISESEVDTANVHNYDACQVMCCLVDWHISRLTETRTVWNARWGLLSALLPCCLCSNGGFTIRHSSDGYILAVLIWSFGLGQNQHFHSTAWIQKRKTACMFCVGNGEKRQEAASDLPSGKLSYVRHCSQEPVPCWWPQESKIPLQGWFSLSQPDSAFPTE